MKIFLAVFFIVAVAFGQAKSTDQTAMPSKEEMSELLSKADEKVSSFQEAVKNAKPYLDKINPKFAANYLAAASEAHTIVASMQKHGESAYGLVSLLATLDDLSLDAATASVQLLRTDEEHVAKGGQPDVGALTAVILLGNASTNCSDISELIMHATLRYVDGEEKVLGKLLESQK
ncbi:MAG TPA: hypothetical protein VKI40_08120 [Terriglobales bacterium]|jgi:hypothetical protein|nr:hypothetical protein [Terriglobales bacterium]